MEVLYSLVLIFTINETQYSESSKHFLTSNECHQMGIELNNRRLTNPPFFIDENGQQIVWFKSAPYYVCVPTSIKE